MKLVQGFSVTEPQATLATRADEDGDISLYLVTAEGREVALMFFAVRGGKLQGYTYHLNESDGDLVHQDDENYFSIE